MLHNNRNDGYTLYFGVPSPTVTIFYYLLELYIFFVAFVYSANSNVSHKFVSIFFEMCMWLININYVFMISI